jgi:hypothetical protein
MMRIFLALRRKGYELIHPVNSEDFEIYARLGEPRLAAWKSPRMHLVHSDEGVDLRRSDSPWMVDHAIMFRPRAIAALRPMLEKHGELLPVDCDDEGIACLNVTCFADGLDEERSSIDRFKSGAIMYVAKWAFRGEALEGRDVFRLPNFRVSPTFFSERFVRLWEESGLEGLDFEPIWSSD